MKRQAQQAAIALGLTVAADVQDFDHLRRLGVVDERLDDALVFAQVEPVAARSRRQESRNLKVQMGEGAYGYPLSRIQGQARRHVEKRLRRRPGRGGGICE